MNREHHILQRAIEDRLLDNETTVLGFMDLDGLAKSIDDLIAAFPNNFQHTFAVKANSLRHVLMKISHCGIGAEVASPGELTMAQSAGFDIRKIIFDSPAKTMDDLRQCLKHSIAFNLDNEQELERVAGMIEDYPNSEAIIGFRINPQIGSGAISSTSTATNTSKFGYPIGDAGNREKLIEYYLKYPWLTSIHTHAGSQGCPLELMAQGIGELVAVAEEINTRKGEQQITRLDIGGGLPVNFASPEVKPTFAEYAEVLRQHVPLLFTGKYSVKTEFGRAIAAKNGFMATRVEYTKNAGGRHIATTHAGAQIMTRTAFLPAAWPIRVEGFTPDGVLKTEDKVQTDVAGPCCFAADLVAKDVLIPRLDPNDYVAIYDTGAYYFSNHFDYNSLPRIAVYGVSTKSGELSIELIRRAETLSEVVSNMS